MSELQFISVVAACRTALSAVFAVCIAYYQLGELVNQRKIQSDRERQWHTIEACQGYVNSEILERSKTKIWEARSKEKVGKLADPLSVKREVIVILNYLDVY